MYDMIHPEQSETAAVRSVFIIDPNKKIRLTMTYPMSVGRNFDEILRVIDALQLGDAKRIATPDDWQKGKDVIIPPSIKDAEAKTLLPQGWTEHRPYPRPSKVDCSHPASVRDPPGPAAVPPRPTTYVHIDSGHPHCTAAAL